MTTLIGQVWAIFPPFETEDGIREILTVEEIRDSLLHRIRIKKINKCTLKRKERRKKLPP